MKKIKKKTETNSNYCLSVLHQYYTPFLKDGNLLKLY